MSKFKNSVSFKSEALEAATNRVADEKDTKRTSGETALAAIAYAKRMPPGLITPSTLPGSRWSSAREQFYLKQLKYHVNLNNLKVNKVGELVFRSAKESFASLREIQRELVERESRGERSVCGKK